MLIYFPQLHAELIAKKVEGALIFDPGVDRVQTEDILTFRPENLPVATDVCRKMIVDFVSYGESLGKMLKMLSTSVSNQKDQFGERSSAIESELNNLIRETPAEKETDTHLIQNQLILALVYAYEEKHLELVKIESNLNDKWAGFGESLGLDEDESTDHQIRTLGGLISNAPVQSGTRVVLPWQKVLESMAAFLPENSALVTSDIDAVSFWRDLELDFYEKEDVLPEKATVVRDKVWKLLGLSGVPDEKPWLDRELLVVLAVPDAE
ncbi:hypothetical protein [Desulfovibrio gilichinskyi]|uniref:Uncharacterized protein n=1 Tax=Desulfovibrio gilichinskyi TaxID=1519643 RepID=A0A1X7C6J1_9BACT|nr:hypothetical protein [Desulfovibrio gilichinskyi]SME90884.1 hypothetical protein SAMN06295933_0414 [Desulfovibrio gilichinskyi]